MMPDKVKNYLLDRKDILEKEIRNLEVEKGRLLEMLEDKTPSILVNPIKRYSVIESGYRVLFKNKNTQEMHRFWTHDRIKDKVSVWPSLSSVQSWVKYYSEIYDLKIIDKDGYECAEPMEKYDGYDLSF